MDSYLDHGSRWWEPGTEEALGQITVFCEQRTLEHFALSVNDATDILRPNFFDNSVQSVSRDMVHMRTFHAEHVVAKLIRIQLSAEGKDRQVTTTTAA